MSDPMSDATAWELTAEGQRLIAWCDSDMLPLTEFGWLDIGKALEAIERAAVARDRAARGTLTVEALAKALHAEAIECKWVGVDEEGRTYTGMQVREVDRADHIEDATAILRALGPIEQSASPCDHAWIPQIASTGPVLYCTRCQAVVDQAASPDRLAVALEALRDIADAQATDEDIAAFRLEMLADALDRQAAAGAALGEGLEFADLLAILRRHYPPSDPNTNQWQYPPCGHTMLTECYRAMVREVIAVARARQGGE